MGTVFMLRGGNFTQIYSKVLTFQQAKNYVKKEISKNRSRGFFVPLLQETAISSFALTIRKNVALLCRQTMNTVCDWEWLTKLLHFSDHSPLYQQVQHILIAPNMKNRMEED